MKHTVAVFALCFGCIVQMYVSSYASVIETLIGFTGIGKDLLEANAAAIEAYEKAHSPLAMPKIDYINIDDFPETRDALGIASSDGPFAMLTEDYTFYNLNGTSVTIPRGFIFDGASIPNWANYVINGTSFSPDMIAAGLIHDYMYRYPGYSKDYADMMICINAALAGNTNPKAIWAGLAAAGFDAYREHQRHREKGDYASFVNDTNGRDYYANNFSKYEQLHDRWTSGQKFRREGPSVFRDIWSDMNEMGLMKNCLGGENWNYTVDKVSVVSSDGSLLFGSLPGGDVWQDIAGFSTSKDSHSYISIGNEDQPPLDYGESVALFKKEYDSYKRRQMPTVPYDEIAVGHLLGFEETKSVLISVHELFLAHMYQINPWAMVGGSFSVNSELNQGFATAMTWLYAKKQGIGFEVFSNNMMDANAKGNNMSNTFKSFLKSVMPDADVSTAEGLATAANRLSADMVYDYINMKAAGIEAVSRMQIRKILDDTKRVSDEWKETLTDNIMAMVNKGADPWTAYEYAKAVAKNKNDDVQAAFAKMQSEMKASQREQCNSCTDKLTPPSTGGGSGNGNENGGSGNSTGSGNSGSGGDGGAGSGAGGGGDGNGSGGGTGTGTGSGAGSGDGNEPGTGADPGDGLPEVRVPLPDVVPLNGDGTRPWDDIVGFTIPYERALFLLSGDIPGTDDVKGAWDGMRNLITNGLDVNEFKTMWETLKRAGGNISRDLDSEIDKIGQR